MPAYVILHNRVTDPEKIGQYLGKVVPTLMEHNAELLVMDEQAEVVEGEAPFPRTIVLKFESREAAMGWYKCAEYQEILPLRLEATEGFAVICDSFTFPAA